MKRSLRSWLWRVPLDQEVDEEIAFHLEMRVRELVDRGMDPIAARSLATARLGDLNRLKRTCMELGRKRDREMRLTRWLDELRDDVKFAVRQLRHSPAFALVAALTLALGIGANGAIFALVDATLLRPLPFPHPDRLVMLWERTGAETHDGVSPLNLADWNSRSRSFERIAGFVPSVGGMVMAGTDGNAETVSRQWVTSGVFEALGVTPIVGRTFSLADDRSHTHVAVLNESFWRTRFNADRAVVGRDLKLDGTLYTIIGVVPERAQVIGRSSIWAMVSLHGAPPQARSAYMLQAVGRLKPGVTFDAATSDLGAIASALAREFPTTNQGRSVTIEPMHDAVIGSDLRFTSMLFLGVVGFVLLMCCANVANLLLARATVRTRELAIRSALGAGRRRVIRQLLTESLVLSTIGGVLGAVVGAAIVSAAPGLIPPGVLPGAVVLTFDSRVVAFCAVTAVLVGDSVRPRPRMAVDGSFLVGDRRHREPDRDRPGWKTSQRARLRRDCSGGAAALRRRLAAADAPCRRERRPRLPRAQRAHDDGRSAWAVVSDRRRIAAVLRIDRARSQRRSRHPQCRVVDDAALGAFGWRTPCLRNRRRDARGRPPASDRRLRDRQRAVFHHHRSADRRGPRLHGPGSRRQRCRLRGERSVRPPLSRRAASGWPAFSPASSRVDRRERRW